MNKYKLNKYISLFLTALLPFITFVIIYISLENNNLVLLYSVLGFVIAFVISLLIANFLLNNPYRTMIEGGGNLILTLDSSGLIVPYIFKTIVPYIKTKIDNKEIQQKFHRDLVNYITSPIETNSNVIQTEEGDLIFFIKKDDYNKFKFKLDNYNVLIYNKVLKSFITKDFFQEKEQQSFLEFLLINFHEDLINTEKTLTNLFRYLGDQFNKNDGIFEFLKNPIVVIIIVILLALFGYMLFPYIIKATKSTQSTITNNVGGVPNVIQPIQ